MFDKSEFEFIEFTVTLKIKLRAQRHALGCIDAKEVVANALLDARTGDSIVDGREIGVHRRVRVGVGDGGGGPSRVDVPRAATRVRY